MANYTDATQIKLMHGDVNVDVWADLDNDDDTIKIAARIVLASTLGTAYIDGRLLRSKYTVPFAATGLPTLIQYLATMLAGVWLYDNRVLSPESNSRRDEMSAKRKRAARTFREILSGQLSLTSSLTGEFLGSSSFGAPIVLEQSSAIPARLCGYTLMEYIHGNCCPCWGCVSKSIVLPVLP